MSKVYFPNLNGLRFIAASLVIVHHVEQFKEILGYSNCNQLSFIKLIGKLGVMLFFVLSGFLITYLLLVEQKERGTIAIKSFYMRRLLRIWPLYFLIIILAFFIIPSIGFLNIGELTSKVQDNLVSKLMLYVFFLPNLALGLFPIIPFASQLWSIGYEEQFYLVWPHLVNKVKNLKAFFITVVLIFIVAKIFALTVFSSYLVAHNYMKIVDVFFSMPSVDSMVIGAFFAYLLFEKSSSLHFLFKKNVQVAIYSLLALFIVMGVFIPFVNNPFYSILFGIVIVNLAANKGSILSLENKVLDFLGKISYGIYMYHAIVIVLVLKTFRILKLENVFLEDLFSISITVLISYISYNYFELFFIRLKDKFSKI